jgi:type II secretory pathway predicted ATPase ExeA
MNRSNATGHTGERLTPWRQFGCRADPFRSGFDADSVYLGDARRHLLEQLRLHIGPRPGVVVITGAPGTGKTTLLHCLAQEIRGRGSEVLFLDTPGPIPSLRALVGACRSQADTAGTDDVKTGDDAGPPAALCELLRGDELGHSRVLIIDEGQSVTERLLVELFTAATSAPNGVGPLPIILAGQPALALRLAKPPVREHAGVILRQYEVDPLAPTEVGEFIGHRLRAAGCREPLPFSDQALEHIARYTGGIPASINALCQLALFFAARDGGLPVDARLVDLAASATLLGPRQDGRGPSGRLADTFVPAPGAAAEIAAGQVRPALGGRGAETLAEPLVARPGDGAAAGGADPAPGAASSGARRAAVEGARAVSAETRRRRPRRRVQLGFWGLAWAPAVVVMAIGVAASFPIGHDKLAEMSATLDAWLAGVTGDQTAPIKVSPPEPSRVAPAQVVEPMPRPRPVDARVRSPEITRLLSLASRYVAEDRLVAPRFDNALAVYREVLRADPGNAAAVEGLDAIRARLLEHAWAEEARGDLESARRQLMKIQLIDAGEPLAGAAAESGPVSPNETGPAVPSSVPTANADGQQPARR